jgi:ATP-binding cassette subfamily B (MDR/TAP) protein 1
MIELLYRLVLPCGDNIPSPEGFDNFKQYWKLTADDMQDLSFKVCYGLIGIIVLAEGETLIHYGFGMAVEQMNKHAHDPTFKNLILSRNFVLSGPAYWIHHDTTSDDAALIHSLSGELIRTIVMNLASAVVDIVVSFVFMHVALCLVDFWNPSVHGLWSQSEDTLVQGRRRRCC